MSSPTSVGLTGFLQLAPTTSASYPQNQRPRQQSIKVDEGATPAVAAPAPGVVDQHEPSQRRSSSMSSDGKKGFLKLGPVHWGEHMEDHQGDHAVE